MAQWLSYPTFSGPFSGQEQLLAASSTSPGAGMIRIPWSAVSSMAGGSPGTGFLPLTGGTLSGPLTLPGNATLPLHAVPLQQVQAITGGPFLQLAGGTLTGPLTLAADPTVALGAATKEYVDGAVAGGSFLPLTGGTVTGPIVLPGNATLPLQAVPLQQVTSIIGGPYLPLGGGTLTGALVLAADPTLSLGAATKQYVDSAVLGGPFLPLAGGTVTGATTFSADVTFSGASTGLAVSNNATVGGTFAATGGINGTSVGAVTPSTGSFTNLTASGTVTLPTTTTGPFLLLTGGTVSGPTTFSASGTALTVTNNATFGGGIIHVGTNTGGSSGVQSTGNLSAYVASVSSFIARGPNGTIAQFADGAGGGAIANSLLFTAQATGSSSLISTQGTDTNRNIRITAAGTGQLLSVSPVALSPTIAVSGAFDPTKVGLSLTSTFSGTSTYGSTYPFNLLRVATDNVALGTQGGAGVFIDHYMGASLTGSRTALWTNLVQNASTGNFAAGQNPFYTSVTANMQMSHNEGGTAATKALSVGQCTGYSAQVALSSGATFFTSLNGLEIDTAIASGASAFTHSALTIVHFAGHAVQGLSDFALGFGDQAGAAVGWKLLLSVSGNGGSQYPVDPAGTLFFVGLGQNFTTNPSMAQHGIDFRILGVPAFNTTAASGVFESNGFAVDGVGATRIGTFYATPSSTGIAIDGKGIVGTGATVSAGGTGYPVSNNNIPLVDAWGGLWIGISNSSGVITSVSVYTDANSNPRYPAYPSTTPPSNPVSTTLLRAIDTGSGCTLTLTWNTTATVLSLQPGGGVVRLGSGCFTANGSTAVTLTALGPSGAHTTVQEWLTITDSAGTVRYIPCY